MEIFFAWTYQKRDNKEDCVTDEDKRFSSMVGVKRAVVPGIGFGEGGPEKEGRGGDGIDSQEHQHSQYLRNGGDYF